MIKWNLSRNEYWHNNKNVVDEVLVSYFIAPKSYTTENMCEINSHGGMVVMNKIYIVSVIFDTHFFIIQSSSS